MGVRWSGSRTAPKVTRTTCRYGCGAEVDAFTDPDIGLVRQLNTNPVPITWDLKHPSLRRQLWEYRGDVVGWRQMSFNPVRGWREIRLAHKCENTERKHESKRKHKKENNT